MQHVPGTLPSRCTKRRYQTKQLRRFRRFAGFVVVVGDGVLSNVVLVNPTGENLDDHAPVSEADELLRT